MLKNKRLRLTLLEESIFDIWDVMEKLLVKAKVEHSRNSCLIKGKIYQESCEICKKYNCCLGKTMGIIEFWVDDYSMQ